MVWQRIRNHPGLAALLILLLVLSAPLVWLGSSMDLLEPVLYSAVIEADVEFDAECNMVSRQITSESGRQDRVAKLEALASEGMYLSSCRDHAGKVMTRSKLWRGWLNLMTFSHFSHENWETTYEWVQG